MADDNPLLDTRLYEVEYLNGDKALLSANSIAQNMFAEVDEDVNRFVLLDSIIDTRCDGSEVKQQDACITSKNDGKRRRETTKGWEVLNIKMAVQRGRL